MRRLVRAIIPAAGAGTRMGLAYPKALHYVDRLPILGHILNNIIGLADESVVVVSPASESQFQAFLGSWSGSKGVVSTVVQNLPAGMGDAVQIGLSFFEPTDCCDYLIVWGDQITVRSETLNRVLERHREKETWLTFPTSWRREPYTHLKRDEFENVSGVLEAREGDVMPRVGENDCGVFVVRGEVLDSGLKELQSLLWNVRTETYERLGGEPSITKEFSFIPLISLWARQGRPIEALPIARPIETIGINTSEDVMKVTAALKSSVSKEEQRH